MLSKFAKFVPPRDGQAAAAAAPKRQRMLDPLPPGRVVPASSRELFSQSQRRQAAEEAASDSESCDSDPKSESAAAAAPMEPLSAAEPTATEGDVLHEQTAATDEADAEHDDIRQEQANQPQPQVQQQPQPQVQPCHNFPPQQPSQVYCRPPHQMHPQPSMHMQPPMMHQPMMHQPTPITPPYPQMHQPTPFPQMHPTQTWMGPGPQFGPAPWQQQVPWQQVPWQQQQQHQQQLHHQGNFAGPQQQHPSFGPSFAQAPAACGPHRPQMQTMPPTPPWRGSVEGHQPGQNHPVPPAGPPPPSFSRAMRTDPAGILLEAEAGVGLDNSVNVGTCPRRPTNSAAAAAADQAADVDVEADLEEVRSRSNADAEGWKRESGAEKEVLKDRTRDRKRPSKGGNPPPHQPELPGSEQHRGKYGAPLAAVSSGRAPVELKPSVHSKRVLAPAESEEDLPDPLHLAVQEQVEAAMSHPSRPPSRQSSAASVPRDFAPPKSRPLGPPHPPQGQQPKMQELRSKAPGPKKPKPENSFLEQLI